MSPATDVPSPGIGERSGVAVTAEYAGKVVCASRMIVRIALALGSSRRGASRGKDRFDKPTMGCLFYDAANIRV